MKKKHTFFAVVLVLLIASIIGIILLFQLSTDNTAYSMEPPEIKNIDCINITQNGNTTTHSEAEVISNIINTIYGVKMTTNNASIQESPINVDNEILIEIHQLGEHPTITLYAYEKHGRFYIEQPYNGVYSISNLDYETLESYIK